MELAPEIKRMRDAIIDKIGDKSLQDSAIIINNVLWFVNINNIELFIFLNLKSYIL